MQPAAPPPPARAVSSCAPTANQLCAALPIAVVQSQLDDNPELALVLSRLVPHLGVNGALASALQAERDADVELRHQRRRLLRNQLLVGVLKRMASGTGKAETNELSKDGRVVLDKLLTVAQTIQHTRTAQRDASSPAALASAGICSALDQDPSSLFAMSEASLFDHSFPGNPKPKLQAMMRREAVPELEARVRARYHQAVRWCQAATDQGSGVLVVPVPGELESQVVRQCSLRAELKQRLRCMDICPESMRDESLELELQCSAMLQQLIVQYECNHLPSALRDNLEFHSLVLNVLRLRHERLQAELKHLTYNTRSVEALQIVRDKMQERVGELQRTHMQRSEELEAYKGLGAEFRRIAVQYGELKKQISDKEWMLMKMLE